MATGHFGPKFLKMEDELFECHMGVEAWGNVICQHYTAEVAA